jgi:predicted metal-dependent hydrolase
MKSTSRPGPAIQLLDKGVMRLETDSGNLSVRYKSTRSRRARYLRLTINRNSEVVLTLPAGCSLDRGLRFMRTKTEWLQRHLAQIGPPEALPDFLADQGFISVEGRAVKIEWRKASEARLSYRRGSSRLVLSFDPARHSEAQLKRVLRQFAAEVLPARTQTLAAAHRLPVRQISVRDQISRWGSCSVRKNVSLNWRLLLLPSEIHDYVIWHELSHLTEMNHSDRFWNLLKRYDPEALENDEALSLVTNRIMSLGRGPDA